MFLLNVLLCALVNILDAQDKKENINYDWFHVSSKAQQINYALIYFEYVIWQ
jgi:hypothetical protein